MMTKAGNGNGGRAAEINESDYDGSEDAIDLRTVDPTDVQQLRRALIQGSLQSRGRMKTILDRLDAHEANAKTRHEEQRAATKLILDDNKALRTQSDETAGRVDFIFAGMQGIAVKVGAIDAERTRDDLKMSAMEDRERERARAWKLRESQIKLFMETYQPQTQVPNPHPSQPSAEDTGRHIAQTIVETSFEFAGKIVDQHERQSHLTLEEARAKADIQVAADRAKAEKVQRDKIREHAWTAAKALLLVAATALATYLTQHH